MLNGCLSIGNISSRGRSRVCAGRLGDDAGVFEFLKRFQTTIVTHDSFGDGKAGYAGNRHAVSRVALGIVNIGRESAEVGGKVGGNVAFAAP